MQLNQTWQQFVDIYTQITNVFCEIHKPFKPKLSFQKHNLYKKKLKCDVETVIFAKNYETVD